MAAANSTATRVLQVSEPDAIIRNWPRDDRPTVKLLDRGPESLTDSELLSVMLQRGSKDRSAVDLAREILAATGSISALLANGDSACPARGVALKPDQRARLGAALELARRALREKLDRGSALSSPQAVRDFLRLKLQGLPHEVFVGVFLDAQNRVLAVEEMFRGTLTQTSVYPREVVKRALHHNAAAVIFAHNHPSGIAEPSRSDEALTQALKQALALVDVKTLDHFVIGAGAAMSFAERGLL